MLTCDGHGFETRGIYSVCCFIFLFFKGLAHVLLNIIKVKPSPVHIRAYSIWFCLILLRSSPAQSKLSLLLIKLYRAKFIRPSPAQIILSKPKL